jgi:hypothetical protein
MGWQAGLAIDVLLLILISPVIAVGAGVLYLVVKLAKRLVRGAFKRWGHGTPLPLGARVRYRDTDRLGAVVAVSATARAYRVDFGTDISWIPLAQLSEVRDMTAGPFDTGVGSDV